MLTNTNDSFYLSLPTTAVNPLNYQYQILQRQQPALWNLPTLHLPPNPIYIYSYQRFGGIKLVCIRHQYQHNFKIMIPDAGLEYMVQWYHEALGHMGLQRLIATMSTHLYHSRLTSHCRQFVQTCDACQRYKNPGRGYGHLAPRQAPLLPFSEIAVDLIGPWKVTVQGKELKFLALTIVDQVSTLSELIRIERPDSEHIAWKLEQAWLCRYPRPSSIIRDQGSEFKGDFRIALERAGLHGITTTVRNAPGNAVCERMHLTVGDILRVLVHMYAPQSQEEATQLVDRALATAQLALRTVVHTTLGVSPGAIVFHRDMLLEIPYIADLLLLQQNRQALIDYNVLRENNRRIRHDYAINDLVLEIMPKDKRPKMGIRMQGPYRVLRVHTNGTLTIERSQGVEERVNIRNFKPYRH
jgi:transposase InsO family protein